MKYRERISSILGWIGSLTLELLTHGYRKFPHNRENIAWTIATSVFSLEGDLNSS